MNASALANPTALIQQPQYVAMPQNQMIQNVTLLNNVQSGLNISGLGPKPLVVGNIQPQHYAAQQPQQTTQNANTINNLINFANPAMVAASTTTPFTTATQNLDATSFVDLAHREYQGGNYSVAEKHCNTVLTSDPQNVSALLLLSSIYFQLKNFDK